MKSLAWLAAGALLIGACSPMKARDGALPNPPARLEHAGLSFLPPAEDDWWIAGRTPDSLVLAKVGKLEGDTSTIEASAIALQPFASTLERGRFVKALREQGLASPRFRIRTHEASERSVEGAACMVSYLLIEDRQPETGTGTLGALLIESLSLICPHPARARVGAMLTYTHRSYPEDQDRAFKVRAGAVLDSFRFADP